MHTYNTFIFPSYHPSILSRWFCFIIYIYIHNIYIYRKTCFSPKSSVTTLKEWKQSRGLIASMQPKFVPDADLSDVLDPKRPSLKLCTMTDSGNIQIPDSERKRWLNDPVRSNLIKHLTRFWHVSVSFQILFRSFVLAITKTRVGANAWRTLTQSSVWRDNHSAQRQQPLHWRST